MRDKAAAEGSLEALVGAEKRERAPIDQWSIAFVPTET
jgi:hypothetical protein